VIRRPEIEDYRRAAAFVETRQYSVVFVQHEFGIYGDLGEFLLEFLQRLVSVKTVVTLHTIDDNVHPLVQSGLIDAVKEADTAVSISTSGCQRLSQLAADRTLKCQQVPHGVPDLPFCEKRNKDDFVIMAGGLLSPGKGLEQVLRGMQQLFQHYKEVHLVIIGEAHPNLGYDYVQTLKDLALKLEINNGVTFVDSFLDDASLFALLASADIYVCAHKTLGQASSGTLVTAMAAGAAIISTPFSQALELVTNDTGLLVPPEDFVALAGALETLYLDRTRLRYMRANAHELMRGRTWKEVRACSHHS
jgi:glycosyltransferase involved in cell wall biosynthesis